jgi:hypothetical protein
MGIAPWRSTPVSDPGHIIADHELRRLYDTFLNEVRGMHDDVRFETTRMETRVFFRDAVLCRVVAYRQLFHVQVGKDNVWEMRVRGPASCAETLDRVLSTFLEVYASGARPL